METSLPCLAECKAVLGTLWVTIAPRGAPFVAEVWEATVDSSERDHTTVEEEDLKVEVAAVVVRAGVTAQAQARAGHEKPSKDAALRATKT